MTKQYVQHISGQGKKWETVVEYHDAWSVMAEYQSVRNERHVLPKSEYVLCEPPVVWKDVTEECVLDECGAILHNGFNTFGDEQYRRRKEKTHTPGGAREFIIIEQKVTG